MKNMLKNKNGITLIALVVTIVVLLILASVTIQMVFSDNGIIKRAQGAAEAQKEAQDKDSLAIMLAGYEVESLTSSKSLLDYFTEQKTQGDISNVTADGENGVLVTLNNGAQYKVNEDGTITPNKGISLSLGTVTLEIPEEGTPGSSKLTASLNQIEGDITWSLGAGGSDIVTLSATTGTEITITAKAVGTTTITATCGDYTSSPCTIKVAKPVKVSDHLGEYVNYDCFTGVDSNLLKYTSKKQFSGSNTAEQVFEITANVKWKLLGTDENGNLLITTADPIQTKAGADYNLQGKTGYTTGPDELDRISGLFGHGQYADTNKYTYSYDGTNVSTAGRSMKVEDANKIQPYTPSAFATHTFKKEEDGYISYDGEPKTKYKTFNYYDETSKTWKSLAKGESIVMPHSMYSYNIGTTNNGQKMLRYKADGSTYAFYWLASRAVYCNNNGSVDYDMRTVYGGVVYRGNGMYYSTGSYSAGSRGVRPVVSLESGAQLTEKVGDTWNLGK